MAPKKESSKKASGNAKKAEVAAQKEAEVHATVAQQEDQEWSKGAKSNAKKEAALNKAAEAQAKKAEKAALLAAEEASLAAKPKASKSASKKTAAPAKPLDLADLDSDPTPNDNHAPATTINASGIDNALDALSLTVDPNSTKIERHPERRFKAAYKAFEERRLPEIEAEHPGLRKNQRVEMARKEFEKSEENPFNQVDRNVGYDAGKDEIAETKKKARDAVESRLGEKS